MAPDSNDTGGDKEGSGCPPEVAEAAQGDHPHRRRGWRSICIGAAYDISTPSADALSILLPGRTADGVGNSTRINILEGNIFNPQLGSVAVTRATTQPSETL